MRPARLLNRARLTLLGLSLLSVPVRPSAAQDDAGPVYPRNAVFFLEKAYFAPLSPIGRGMTFQGEAAMHYFVWNGLDWGWTRSGGWRLAVPVTMHLTVRMSNDYSRPVRTPSYHIRPVFVQLIRGAPEGTESARFSVWGVQGGWTHYSNGQSGCTYEGFVRDTTTDGCSPSNAALAARRIANTRDGDFSTSFFSVAWNWRVGRQWEVALPLKWQQTLGVELQAHPLEIPFGGMNGAQAKEYGQHQVGASWELEWRSSAGAKGTWRTAARAALRVPYDGGRQVTFGDVEGSYVWDRAQDFGLFARVHVGADDYNINFQDRRTFVVVGAVFDPGHVLMHQRTGRPFTR